MNRYPELTKLSEELEKAKESHALLEELWAHFGPYGVPDGVTYTDRSGKHVKMKQEIIESMKLPASLVTKLHRYFKFDDGE